MRIDATKCVGCGQCRPFCIMQVIDFARTTRGNKVFCVVNEDECVDCEICYRAKVCPVDALHQPETTWPRSIRGTFSNPLAIHKETAVPGRGTEEMKTNDITDRYKRGFAGMSAEMGRPGIGARLRDAEKVFMALAPLGVEFEPQNPLTNLLVDKSTGKMNPEVLDEKVLSCIVEMIVPLDQIVKILDVLEKVAKKIDTVFSIDLVCRCDEDLSVPSLKVMEAGHRWYTRNGKTNIGLGKLEVKGARQ
ncbi:MAG: ferredoxin family protein [Anaerotruncus sp.]|jgi:NAD-dependent dihydropyrimidine dehydrogenase PreA subunit|nr:ferredoxin family protein [Anaerotruncus sp.]